MYSLKRHLTLKCVLIILFKKNLRCLFFIALFAPFLVSAQKKGQPLIDSLKGELVNAAQDTNRVKLLDKLSYSYVTINPDSGIVFGQKALDLATALGWQKGQANAYSDLSTCYNAKSNTAAALEYNRKALQLFEKLKHARGVAAIMVNNALIYHSMSDYSKALTAYLGSLRIFDSLKDNSSRAIVLENIGTLYLEQNDFDKTLHYYQQAQKIYDENADIAGIARNTANLGIVYYKQHQSEKALKHHEISLKLNKQIGNKYGVQLNLSNIGLVYLQLEDFQKALSMQFKALEISKELGSNRSIATSLGNIGGTYYQLAMKNEQHPDKALLTKAVAYLEDAIRICKEIGYTAPIAEFGPSLSEAYSLLGDNKKAYSTFKEFTVLKDSVFSLQKNAQLANLESRYLIEKQEKDILDKNRQLQIAGFKAERQQYIGKVYVLSIIVMVLVLGILGWAIISYRARNQSLSVTNKENETTIKEQLVTLKASNAALKKIAHIQSHDVRGPVATILGLSQLLNIKDPGDPANQIIVDGIASAAQALDTVIKNVVLLENKLGVNENMLDAEE